MNQPTMMNNPFSSIIGNDLIKDYLLTMVRKDRIGNSFLFAGTCGIGKSLFAECLAKLILKTENLNNHPDVHIYKPEGKLGLHSIDSMRQMCEKVYLAPFSSDRKVFIIHSAEKMLPTSANSLLKTFEEPSPDTIIILLSSNPGALLPTILSRCRTLRFRHIDENDIANFLIKNCNKNEAEAKQIATHAGGSIGKAFNLSANESDPVRLQLIDLLKSGKKKFYSEITDSAKSISEYAEEIKKKEETAVKALLTKDHQSTLTAAQTHNLTKEIEGAVSLKQAELSLSIFDVIISWYRDLHLLKNNGNPSLLINSDHLKDLQNQKTTQIPSIESILKMTSEAKLLLERSTSLHIVLENLFLKLGLI